MEQLLNFFQKGGIVIYPLLLCSIIAVTIVIEKSIALRKRKVIIPEIVSVIQNLKSAEDIGLALSICEKHKGAFAAIIRTGLENRHLPKEEIKEILTDQGRQEVYQLEKGLPALETIAGIAPLMGLLGTVLGILKVFNVISSMGVGQANALAGGISEALITTIVGLAIGIPALVVFNYFSTKSEQLILEIEKFSTLMISKIYSFKNSI
jgi:biopolymer transport protein ExbB